MLRLIGTVYASYQNHILQQSNKGISTAAEDIMTPALITETVAAVFEAQGSPMMTRAARLCVSMCATYAGATAAAVLPQGTQAIMRAVQLPESERVKAGQIMQSAISAGNVMVRRCRVPILSQCTHSFVAEF